MISYAITVNDEWIELDKLIKAIEPYIGEEDEVVILHDWKDDAVHNDIKNYSKSIKNVNYVQSKLNGDFSKFKNQMIDLCTKKWIVHFDADELPSPLLICNIKDILLDNDDIEVFIVPRANIVYRITDEHIKKWGWNQNERGWINWPDLQQRIWRNKSEIRWYGKVHERLKGYTSWSSFDTSSNTDFLYYHIKGVERQEQQNEFYETL